MRYVCAVKKLFTKATHPIAVVFAIVLGCTSSRHMNAPLRQVTAASVASANDNGATGQCAGKSGCVQKELASHRYGRLMRLELSASSEQDSMEHCQRREYWWHGKNRDALIALDCADQWGADSQGPVTIELKGDVLVGTYLEFQASDLCERFEFEIGLPEVKAASSQRWSGESADGTCSGWKKLRTAEKLGDGSDGQPLVQTHLEFTQ